jgi:hypothetical protein
MNMDDVRQMDKDRIAKLKVKHAVLERLDEIMEGLFKEAVNGNTTAAKILLERGLGVPQKASEQPAQIPSLQGLNPLQQLTRLSSLVSSGELSIANAKSLAGILEAEIRGSQLTLISGFIKRLASGEERVEILLAEYMPQLQALEAAFESEPESNTLEFLQ